MIVKVLKKGITFSIGTTPDLKWISNENLEKFLGLEFPRISSWNFNLDETWTRYLYLHLVSNSIYGGEFKVQSRNFLS
jgi:hypothetical protein